MKKIMAFATTILYAAMFSTVAAGAGESGKAFHNGITDFTGKSIDTLYDIYQAEPGVMHAAVESSSAGGLRSTGAGEPSYNGITDFTGRSVDTLYDLYPAESGAMRGAVESSSAGGSRLSSDKPSFNGITDFSGKSYDTLSDLTQ